MTDESEDTRDTQRPVEQLERPNLERAFKEFLESGQPTIPNVVVVPPQRHDAPVSGIGSELRTAAYAIGLAALLAGAIFGGIALGTQYSTGYLDGKVQEQVDEATKDLKSELRSLQDRINELESTAHAPAN